MLTEKEIKRAFAKHGRSETDSVLCSLHIPEELLSSILASSAQKSVSIYQYITEAVLRELVHPRPIKKPKGKKNVNHIEITWRLTFKQFEILQKAAARIGMTAQNFVLASLLTDSAECVRNKTGLRGHQSPPDKTKKSTEPKTKPTEQSYLCNMRIGAADKIAIQKAAAKAGMTFQQFAIEAAERRIRGESPQKLIRRKQLKNFDAVITCRFTDQQRKRIRKAARAERTTITNYLLGAMFGDYQPTSDSSVQAGREQIHQRSAAVRKSYSAEIQTHYYGDENVLSQTPAQKHQQSELNNRRMDRSHKSGRKEQTYLCNMRIGSADKIVIQKAAARKGMTFQQFAIEATERRINGEIPEKRIRRKQLKNFDAVITCRFTDRQRKRVRKAARTEMVSVTDYVLGAIFGDYVVLRQTEDIEQTDAVFPTESASLGENTNSTKQTTTSHEQTSPGISVHDEINETCEEFAKNDTTQSVSRDEPSPSEPTSVDTQPYAVSLPPAKKQLSFQPLATAIRNIFTQNPNSQEKSYPYNIPIGTQDRMRVQKAARKFRMTIQQYIVESVKRKLIGKQPLRIILHKQSGGPDGITCRLTNSQKKRITAAANASNMTFNEYILSALFGDTQKVKRNGTVSQLEPITVAVTAPLNETVPTSEHTVATELAPAHEDVSQINPVEKEKSSAPTERAPSPEKVKTEVRKTGKTLQQFEIEGAKDRICGEQLFNNQKKAHFQTHVQKYCKTDSSILKESEFFESEKGKQTFTCDIWLGSNENARFGAIVNQSGMPIRDILLKRVFQRLIGKPPAERIECGPIILNKGTVIHCSLTKKQQDLISRAASAAGTTVPRYILDAAFGNYTAPRSASSAKDSTRLFSLCISKNEKEQIQRAADFDGISFRQYILRSIKDRLEGLPPRRSILCSMFPDTVTNIIIPKKVITNRWVINAAKKANETLIDYIRFAVFGSYKSRYSEIELEERGGYSKHKEVTPTKTAVPPLYDESSDADDDYDGLVGQYAAKDNLEKEDVGGYRDYAHVDYEETYRHIIKLDDLLEPFINKVRKIKPPQHGEFSKLFDKAEKGDKSAKKRIREMYIRTAVRIAYLTAKQFDLDISDCINEACIGLFNAIDKTKPVQGRPVFRSLGWRIRSNIIRSTLIASGTCIRLPASFADIFPSAYKCLKEKGCLTCPDITDCAKARQSIFAATGCSEDQIEHLIRITALKDLLDPSCENQSETTSDDEENPEIEEEYNFEYPDPNNRPEQDIISQEHIQRLRNALKRLNYREREIIKLRYGLADGYCYTLKEVGHFFRVTRERIRQIEAKAIKKLQQPALSQGLVGCID